MNKIILAINPRFGIFWHNETGAGHALNGAFVTYGLIGSGDIIGFTKKGRFVSIEVKTGTGALRKSQINFRMAVLQNCGIYIVGRSVEQVIAELEAVWTS